MKGKEGVYRLKIDMRYGCISGIFISTNAKVEWLIESEISVYFGEIMGKHSKVYGSIDRKYIELITESEDVLRIVKDNNLIDGVNPFNYTSKGFEIDGECLYDVTIDEIYDKLYK